MRGTRLATVDQPLVKPGGRLYPAGRGLMDGRSRGSLAAWSGCVRWESQSSAWLVESTWSSCRPLGKARSSFNQVASQGASGTCT
jgi:hypothetical protein